MKRSAYILGVLISLLSITFTGCDKDEATEQADNTVFTPRILNSTVLFPASADSVRILSVGQNMNFTGLQYSPGGKVKISWKVNDVEVATTDTFNFVATEGGDFRVKVEASYEGMTVSRYRDIFVIPATYTPKTYSNVVMAYVSDTGTYKSIDFNNVTHVAYKVATMTAAGAMDVSLGETGRKAEAFVGRAHLKGVPVLLGISGALSGDGWAVSTSNNFGAVISDATKRAALVQTVKNYITAKRMDGVDIMMTDINSTNDLINAAIAGTGSFLNELRTALGTQAIITVTVTSNTYYSRYPDLSAATWLNVHAFEDGLHVGPGKALGQPSGYDYMVTCAGLWKAKYPTTKLVIGIPAFGLQYNSLDANGNNLSWTSYSYTQYKAILAAVPTAYDQEYAAIAKGVYFNGVPMVTQKAAYLKANGYLGVYIWAGNYDVLGDHSLTSAIYNQLK